jgi:hypothetical protein
MSILILSSTNNISQANSLEKLLMPGELIDGHKKYEDECSNCHQPLGKVSQRTLCLDCHKKIRKDVVSKKGFHGKSIKLNSECKTCHTDHKGRNVKIVLFNKQDFNHNDTDFKLKGHHQNIDCSSCHTAKKKFRDAKHECIDCHKNTDIHSGELGKECDDCHSEVTWLKTRFNHNKTKFKLKGEHKKVACLSCHITQTYTDAPTTCYACHQINDIHNNRFGQDCQDCHNEKKWAAINFNHDKTDYPLTGRHKKVSCNTCHTPSSHNKKLPLTCIGCHRQDDTHSGRNGNKCKNCHTTRSWKSKFNHQKTDFPLHGKHSELACTTCHKGDVYKDDLPIQCVECHKQDDVHQGSEGKTCANCHNENAWQEKILFDHDVTHFPLSGLHASVSCDDCHASSNFKDTESTCISCHEDDDAHKNTLGKNCQQCHTPSSWNLWLFDHDEQTKFKLEGKHSGLVCDACHTKPVVKDELKLPSDCYDCHKTDDVHDGRFGRKCDKCHDNESFEHFTFERSQ